MAKPVVIVPSGGVPVTNVARFVNGCAPMTPVAAHGMAVTLADNAMPVTLVNVDGSLWSDGGGSNAFTPLLFLLLAS